ncbi:hypothetical protein DH2020_002564 [Rehmannia glutinosa]|uniref:10 kDa chaperonin n=1 Tax=Rehmannia glutinosa TaxID=99300 RepID=A0ABR0XU25_REHGL
MRRANPRPYNKKDELSKETKKMVVPQADRVLVRLEALPEKSAGGVLLPKSAVKFERYLVGEVLSVGAEVGEVETGKKVDLGTEARHCFCKAGDLLAVVE